jgi:uncharacterized protein YbjT (DUF2867 family)
MTRFGARRCLRASPARTGSPHVSAIDRALFGYFGMNLVAEPVVEQSGIGWTTLRATQFHDLILMVGRALAKLPVIPFPAGVVTGCLQPDVSFAGSRLPPGP